MNAGTVQANASALTRLDPATPSPSAPGLLETHVGSPSHGLARRGRIDLERAREASHAHGLPSQGSRALENRGRHGKEPPRTPEGLAQRRDETRGRQGRGMRREQRPALGTGSGGTRQQQAHEVRHMHEAAAIGDRGQRKRPRRVGEAEQAGEVALGAGPQHER
jgi:hypothetical protein